MKKLVLLLLVGCTAGFAQTATMKFKAEIANRNSDTIYIQSQSLLEKIVVNKKGVFEKTFEAPKGVYQMSDGTEYTQMYLQPGYDLVLKMDAKKFDESIMYSGNGSKENNILMNFLRANAELDAMMDTATKDDFASKLAKSTASTEAALAATGIDAEFSQKLGASVKQQAQMMLMMYEQNQVVKGLVGKPAPATAFENHKGGTTKLSDFKGKYVYVDVWATWCGPCRVEIPHLQEIEKKYHGKNIEIVSISIDAKKDYDKWKNLVKDKNLGGVQLLAEGDWNSELVKQLGISGIPRFILIDPKGNILDPNAPRPSEPRLVEVLDGLLKG